MSLESPFQLKHTNVSRPRLSHSDSKQSITASEGYYSVHSASSEIPTSESDERSKPSPAKYHTPPSHHRTPTQSHEHLALNSDIPSTHLKGVGIPRQQPQSPGQPPLTQDHHHQSPTVSTIAEERPETQQGRNSRHFDMDSESLATTPGMDDTPYIRFAIDQLTRDEEVRGSRAYPQPSVPEDYPVERMVPDDGLGYMQQEQELQRKLSHPPPPKPKQIPVRSGDAIPPRDVFVQFRPSPQSLPHAPLNFVPAILRPLWLGLFILACSIMLAALIFVAIYSNRSGGLGLWDYGTFGDVRYFVLEYLPTLLGMIILVWLFQVQIALQRIIPFMAMTSESTQKRSNAVFIDLYPMQFLVPRLQYFKAGQPLFGAFYLISWLFYWTIPLLASAFNVRYDTNAQLWRWLAVQGVVWATAALYILLIIALLMIMIILLRTQTGLKWDPRSLADIIALLERSNIMGDYAGSETWQKHGFKHLGGRSDRLGYWSTTRKPNDVFYGIGEEGADTRRYSVEQGRIREKGPERSSFPDATSQGDQQPGDFSIRMDIRSERVRLRYLPWYLRDTSVIAWIVTVVVLLVAFLVVSFVNSAARLGFLPQVFARTDASGFSASNFLYSFVPAFIGHLFFLAILTYDYSLRNLRPYMTLSSKGGATAEQSLLVDYSSRLPLSATLAALENKHYQNAVLSLVSLCSTAIPVLAGGCFWTQWYTEGNVVRVAADLPGYYALCVFLALYAVGAVALLPSRRRAALPHESNTISEIISWVYQSQIITDRAFARPQTKSQLVARLMGSAYLDRTWAQSLSSLLRPSRNNLRSESPQDDATEKAARHHHARKGKAHKRAPSVDEMMTANEKRVSVLEPGTIRYGFGIHVGRDGLEHLGIDRVSRGGARSGRELVIYEEQRDRDWAAGEV
ncbi:hypothetical protein BU24DRAFT_430493 [Aaosphaeria arxii CBS 175.79]|uniref:Uncharacterized protein n=1 Tax=Aaosphaeria arxii CBS 175.79 TaxID=1450172 RepID=A0A6A5Y9E2_9PLEO|nr:uncharacterized protein BU24DRAFT_430493 [Aaosphaeria arxii CBS 175.79]KAF2022038.1 hypothetical protein BU24DRAFT_430493 [Aaosphaeria arxii CBS 175.79]